VHAYEVGKLYNPARKMWPQTPQFNLRGGELELVLFFDSPTAAEVAAVHVSAAEFALYHDRDQVVLCYRFRPGVPWSDAPYSYHLIPEAERIPPPDPEKLGPETRALLHILLVNATGGEIRVLRAVTLSPEFTRSLYAAISTQAQLPWDKAWYDRRLAELYRRYSTTEALVQACQHRTKGGA
jgi:hypothetical protein